MGNDALQKQGNVNKAICYYSVGIANTKFGWGIWSKEYISEAYVGRGLAYAERGEFKEAIHDLTAAIGVNRDNENAYLNRGALYMHLGNIEKARADFLKRINLSKKKGFLHYATSLTTLGSLYELTGEKRQANALYREAWEAMMQRSPKGTESAYYDETTLSIRLALIERDFKRAGKYLLETIKKFPEAETSYAAFLGDIYYGMKSYRKAITSYKKALQFEPEQKKLSRADIYYALAKAYYAKDNAGVYSIPIVGNILNATFKFIHLKSSDDAKQASLYISKVFLIVPRDLRARILYKKIMGEEYHGGYSKTTVEL